MTSTPLQLQEWAGRWNVPPHVLADLLQIMGVTTPSSAHDATGRTGEDYVQSLVRLEAPRYGVWLTRNNVGAKAWVDDMGNKSFIRWGLANESARQNEVIKSGDLIGWRSITVEPRHVGMQIAQFVSRECKRVDWKWSGDAHERAQLAWANLVTRAGGDARFVTGEGSFNVW